MLEPKATMQQEQAVLNNTEFTPNIISIYNDEGAGENSVKYVLDKHVKLVMLYLDDRLEEACPLGSGL